MILDTNVLSALFAGDAALSALLDATERHHLPVVVLGEYRFGLLRSRQRLTLQNLLEILVRDSIVLPVDERTAVMYAAVREELREKGKPIPENDVWIAALARQHGLPVVSRDGHFEQVQGIRHVTW